MLKEVRLNYYHDGGQVRYKNQTEVENQVGIKIKKIVKEVRSELGQRLYAAKSQKLFFIYFFKYLIGLA